MGTSRMSIVIIALTRENCKERDHEKFPGWVSKEKQYHKYQKTQDQASDAADRGSHGILHILLLFL